MEQLKNISKQNESEYKLDGCFLYVNNKDGIEAGKWCIYNCFSGSAFKLDKSRTILYSSNKGFIKPPLKPF